MKKFWNMNGRVGSNEVAGMVGKWGVVGGSENDEYLIDIYAEIELFLTSLISIKKIHRYTWRRE